MSQDTEIIERLELIEKLEKGGHARLISVLRDHSSYTRAGRLNKSAVCRRLRWPMKKLNDAILACRELLAVEFDVEEENDI